MRCVVKEPKLKQKKAKKSKTKAIMRLVYRNRRAAVLGMLCICGVMMVLMKYTELGPTCLFREEQSSIMVREDVSIYIMYKFCLYKDFCLDTIWKNN